MTIFCDKYLNLPLRRRFLIIGINSPAILLIHTDLMCAHVHHWFNGKHHTRCHHHLCALFINIANPWIFMKFQAHTVSADIPYNLIAVGHCMVINSLTHIAQKTPRLHLLKTQLDKYVGNYRYMVVDNEAGLEHISRGLLPHVDTMLLISDCSRRGIQAVGRIAEMIREMNLNPGEMKLIVNRAPNGELNPGVMEEINKYGLQLAGVLPQDDTVYTYDCEGKPSSQVPDTAPVKKALAAIMQELKL